jgi:hypothetical protein
VSESGREGEGGRGREREKERERRRERERAIMEAEHAKPYPAER